MQRAARWFGRLALTTALLAGSAAAAAPYAWRVSPGTQPLETRFAPPRGYQRPSAAAGSLAAWLRGLPILPGRPPVRLHDGRLKGNQTAHVAVVDIDVGARDRQQCADAAMRLWGEYLWSAGRHGDICFRFTSGEDVVWTDWRQGLRPRVKGRRVSFLHGSPPAGDYASFRRYLDMVFVYAGSMSLSRELAPVPDERQLQAGDVFIQGGFPGHAVIVLDVAQRGPGDRVFLLAQSYMPAQQIHVLANPAGDATLGPWYRLEPGQRLVTPEWTFPPGSLRRFGERRCTPREAR